MSSINERAVAAVFARLALIQIANGYYTDAGAALFDSRANLDPVEIEDGAIVVWEDGEEPQDGTGSGNSAAMNIDLTLRIDAHAPAERPTTGTILRRLKADIKRAVLVSPGLADDLGKLGFVRYLRSEPSPRVDGGVSESVSVLIVVRYKEAYGNPDAIT